MIDRSRSRGRNQKFRVEARDRDKRRENRGLRSSQPKAGRDQVEAGRATVKSTGGAGRALFAGLHKRTGALGLDLALAAQVSGVQIESQEKPRKGVFVLVTLISWNCRRCVMCSRACREYRPCSHGAGAGAG